MTVRINFRFISKQAMITKNYRGVSGHDYADDDAVQKEIVKNFDKSGKAKGQKISLVVILPYRSLLISFFYTFYRSSAKISCK